MTTSIRERGRASNETIFRLLFGVCMFLVGHYFCFVSTSFAIHDIVLIQEELSLASSRTNNNDLDVKRHSYGLLDGISNDFWKEIREKTIAKSWYANPENPLENHKKVFEWNSANLLPNFQCPLMMPMPMGVKGDTKYVCNPERLHYEDKPGGCLIYSFGCAGDFRFEDEIFEMHKGQCEIHIFDPSPKYERPGDVQNKNIHYHPWALRSTYDSSGSYVYPWGTGGGVITFPELRKRLGHENRTIDIMKIDCEGCEWSTAKDWIGSAPRQILMEIHGVPSPDGTPRQHWYRKKKNPIEWYDMFREHGYVLFNKDPNMDCCLELAFLKMDDDFWKKDKTPALPATK